MRTTASHKSSVRTEVIGYKVGRFSVMCAGLPQHRAGSWCDYRGWVWSEHLLVLRFCIGTVGNFGLGFFICVCFKDLVADSMTTSL